MDCSLAVCYNIIFISGRKFLSYQWRQLLELALVLFLLAISISDYICLAHIVEIRMNSLSVSFQDGTSCSYFSRKLFEFWAYANSLDHLDCSLAVFYNIFLFQESNFSTNQWRQCLNLCLYYFSWPFRFKIVYTCVWLIVEIKMNSLSVAFRDGSSSSFFWGSCSNFELLQIFWIIWIAVWQYFLKNTLYII